MKKLPILLFIFLLLAGCRSSQPAYEADIFAMDTVMSLDVWADDESQTLTEELVQIIQELEAELSVTRANSAISAANAGQTVQLSGTVATLLDGTLALSGRTGGALDPTIYPVLQLWGFTTENKQVPAPDALAEALAHTGADRVHLDGTTLQLEDGCQLDFGAVAKGYAGQLCADHLLQAAPDCAAMLMLGGNAQTVGTKPDGSAWRVGITDPDDPAAVIAVLELTGTHSIVTSGGYQRYFEQDGEVYCHIIDPTTGYPADTGLTSVTIVCQNGLLADGLSTALYVMGPEAAVKFWRGSNDFEMVLIAQDRGVLVTEGLTDGFTCDAAYEVLTR